MERIAAAGMGTYYAYRGAYSGANAREMRCLVWLAKNNRPKPPEADVAHPEYKWTGHLSVPADAYEYVAGFYAVRRTRLLAALGLANTRTLLVPLPASSTTRASPATERWPARELARALAGRGFGSVCLAVVNKQPTNPHTATGSTTPAHEVARNTDIVMRPALGNAILYVDDVITRGNRVAGVDQALGVQRRRRAAICVAFTGETDGLDCYKSRLREVRYEVTLRPPWVVGVFDHQLPGQR